MANYPAPTTTLPIFSPSVFDTNDIPLTIEEGADYFITYPTAQGAITIPTLSTGTLNVSGTATIGTATITTAGVSGTATIGTATITTASVSGTLTTNVIAPSYTTLSLAATNIGYSYTPTITIALAAGDIGTESVGVGVWLVSFYIVLTGATATYLSVRDAVSGGGTEYFRAYENTDSYAGSCIIPVSTGTKTITIRQVGVSGAAGTGTQRMRITRIA